MSGHNKAFLPGSSTANIAFGTNGSSLVAVLNQSNTAQSNGIAVYDAPASAVASPTSAVPGLPNGYPLLFRVTVGSGNSGLLGSLNLHIDYGVVIVPSGIQNSDGGLTFLYD